MAHGATGKGNDQVRFELTYYALDPDDRGDLALEGPRIPGRVPGPVRHDRLRPSATESRSRPRRTGRTARTRNLIHISHESGILEDPAADARGARLLPDPEPAGRARPRDAPRASTSRTASRSGSSTRRTASTRPIRYELFRLPEQGRGRKRRSAGWTWSKTASSGSRAGASTRSPGMTILRAAHMDIEGIAMDREVMRLRDMLAPKFSEIVYDGFWFSPEMDFLMAAIDKSQEVIDGVVHLALYKGNVTILGRESHSSLYDKELSSMDIEGGFNQQDSAGFIRHPRHPPQGPQRDHEQAGQEGHGLHEERPMKVWDQPLRGPARGSAARSLQRLDREDAFLAGAEIAASRAYARALRRAGVLTAKERPPIDRGLVRGRSAGSTPGEDLRTFEDIHSAVELLLVEEIGEAGQEAPHRPEPERAGRDRRAALPEGRSPGDPRPPPGLPAGADRPRRRISRRRPARLHPSPAGPARPLLPLRPVAFLAARAGQVAAQGRARPGSTSCPSARAPWPGPRLPIDRAVLARSLGFAAVSENSLDAVADRSFILETLFALALLLLDIGRFAEDVVVFASREFGFLVLDDALATSSSLMPQKKNPDIFELLRAGRRPAVRAFQPACSSRSRGCPRPTTRISRKTRSRSGKGSRTRLALLEVFDIALRSIRPGPRGHRPPHRAVPLRHRPGRPFDGEGRSLPRRPRRRRGRGSFRGKSRPSPGRAHAPGVPEIPSPVRRRRPRGVRSGPIGPAQADVRLHPSRPGPRPARPGEEARGEVIRFDGQDKRPLLVL